MTATNKAYTTVGVTGHIDHGKTTLVGVLTGVDTDTHPEEKRRGITIDLGFAAYQEANHTFAFIDAPGHQKYVGNLLAGVSAVDIGLLVVACDQGIQQQTLEHAGILKTLGVPKLIVAMTRVDLASAERQAELTEELEVFLSDFGFDAIPVIPVSSSTREGIDELRECLMQAADATTRPADWLAECCFRMPIDRVLNVPGRGLVVAGTIWSGSVAIGETLRFASGNEGMRVREIEVHGQMATESQFGMRTALNLTGQIDREIRRGEELVGLDASQPSPQLILEIELHPEASELQMPATVQLHTGTTSCSARISGGKLVAPRESAIVVAQPDMPLYATLGQACLLRRPYPVGSVAGGRVLATFPSIQQRPKKDLVALGEQLAMASDAVTKLRAWTDYLGEHEVSTAWCWEQLGLSESQVEATVRSVLSGDADGPQAVLKLGPKLVSQRRVEKARHYLLRLLEDQAKERDDAWAVEESLIKRAVHVASPLVIRHALNQLAQEQAIVSLNGMFAVASEKTLLSKKQRAKMEQMIKLFDGARMPPTAKELATQLAVSADMVMSLLRHATQQRVVIDLGQGFYISNAVFETLCEELAKRYGTQPELSVAEIRDTWQITRKHAIPLLEYCDKQQITNRRQDARVAGPQLATKFASQKEDA